MCDIVLHIYCSENMTTNNIQKKYLAAVSAFITAAQRTKIENSTFFQAFLQNMLFYLY